MQPSSVDDSSETPNVPAAPRVVDIRARLRERRGGTGAGEVDEDGHPAATPTEEDDAGPSPQEADEAAVLDEDSAPFTIETPPASPQPATADTRPEAHGPSRDELESRRRQLFWDRLAAVVAEHDKPRTRMPLATPGAGGARSPTPEPPRVELARSCDYALEMAGSSTARCRRCGGAGAAFTLVRRGRWPKPRRRPICVSCVILEHPVLVEFPHRRPVTPDD